MVQIINTPQRDTACTHYHVNASFGYWLTKKHHFYSQNGKFVIHKPHNVAWMHHWTVTSRRCTQNVIVIRKKDKLLLIGPHCAHLPDSGYVQCFGVIKDMQFYELLPLGIPMRTACIPFVIFAEKQVGMDFHSPTA